MIAPVTVVSAVPEAKLASKAPPNAPPSVIAAFVVLKVVAAAS